MRFLGYKMHESRFLAWAPPRNPLATTLPQDTQSAEEGESVPHFASYEYSLTAVGSRCDVVSGELARRCVRRGAVEDSGSGVVHRMWAW